MGKTYRRAQATPSLRRAVERWLGRRFGIVATPTPDGTLRPLVTRLRRSRPAACLLPFVRERATRIAANAAVAALVLSLPYASTAAQTNAQPPGPSSVDAPRVQAQSRGVITAGRSPVTVSAEGTPPITEYTLSSNDTLASLANFFHVSPEAIAYANGISDPLRLQIDRTIRIPPADGALYTVAEGDTVESVATKFKVDPTVIMSYNRLYFEPEHFAPGQLIFVRGAALPGLVYETVEPEPQRPTVIARPAAPPPPPARAGRLAWPLGGVITQYFWWGHPGTDIAAPYGTGIAASESGTVISAGWVAVGGIAVRIQHAGGLETGYYHMSAVYVAPGQYVSRGQIIGAVGLTGVTTGPHVHWECKLGGRLVNCLAQ